MRIEECTSVDAQLVEAIGRLIPQLSDSAQPPSEVQLREIVDSPRPACSWRVRTAAPSSER
jgi:hypothetical protein